MAQSYANPNGSGRRNTSIRVTSSQVINGIGMALVDGSQENNCYFGGGESSRTLTFDFLEPRVIDEAKWYQDIASANGTWRWRGSNDASTYTVIGGTFTLGSVATQTHTALNANTTAYRFYQLQQTGGTTSSSPYTREVEFRIDDGTANTSTYTTKYGWGDRRAFITITTNCMVTGGDAAQKTRSLLDGNITAEAYFTAGAANEGDDGGTAYVQFDFDAPVCLVEAAMLQSGSGAQGTWRWQAWTGSAWTNIGNTFTLGVANATGLEGGQGATHHSLLTQLAGNTTKYSRYRLLQTASTRTSTPYISEFGFKVKTDAVTPPPVTNDRRRQSSMYS